MPESNILDIEDFAVRIREGKSLASTPIGKAQSGSAEILSLRKVARRVHDILTSNPGRPLFVELARPTLEDLKEKYGSLSEKDMREVATNQDLALLLVSIGYIASYDDLIKYGFEFPKTQRQL